MFLHGISSKEYTSSPNTSLLSLHPKKLVKAHNSVAKRTIWGSAWNLLAGSRISKPSVPHCFEPLHPATNRRKLSLFTYLWYIQFLNIKRLSNEIFKRFSSLNYALQHLLPVRRLSNESGSVVFHKV